MNRNVYGSQIYSVKFDGQLLRVVVSEKYTTQPIDEVKGNWSVTLASMSNKWFFNCAMGIGVVRCGVLCCF